MNRSTIQAGSHYRVLILALFLALLVTLPLSLQAREAVVMVTQVMGQVTHSEPQGQTGKQPLRSFKKLAEKSEIQVEKEASVRLVYIGSGVQEFWQGPARFQIGGQQSLALSGEPRLSSLPIEAGLQIQQLSPTIQLASIQRGGVTLTKAPPFIPLMLTTEHKLYKTLRKQAPADDWTPELYWLSVLQQAGETALLETHIRSTLRRFPALEQAFQPKQP